MGFVSDLHASLSVFAATSPGTRSVLHRTRVRCPWSRFSRAAMILAGHTDSDRHPFRELSLSSADFPTGAPLIEEGLCVLCVRVLVHMFLHAACGARAWIRRLTSPRPNTKPFQVEVRSSTRLNDILLSIIASVMLFALIKRDESAAHGAVGL